MNIPGGADIHYRGRQLERYDAVIPRIGSAITLRHRGAAPVRSARQLPAKRIRGHYPRRDKLRSLQLLARRASICRSLVLPIRPTTPAT